MTQKNLVKVQNFDKVDSQIFTRIISDIKKIICLEMKKEAE